MKEFLTKYMHNHLSFWLIVVIFLLSVMNAYVSLFSFPVLILQGLLLFVLRIVSHIEGQAS